MSLIFPHVFKLLPVIRNFNKFSAINLFAVNDATKYFSLADGEEYRNVCRSPQIGNGPLLLQEILHISPYTTLFMKHNPGCEIRLSDHSLSRQINDIIQELSFLLSTGWNCILHRTPVIAYASQTYWFW